MISSKILRGLSQDKQYLVFDSICYYKLIKCDNGAFMLSQYGWGNSGHFYIYEKNLESLQRSSRDIDEDYYFYKYTYKDTGKTNRWKCISTVGTLSIHGDFSFNDLYFFGEIKEGVDMIKEARRFRRLFTKEPYWGGFKDRLIKFYR